MYESSYIFPPYSLPPIEEVQLWLLVVFSSCCPPGMWNVGCRIWDNFSNEDRQVEPQGQEERRGWNDENLPCHQKGKMFFSWERKEKPLGAGILETACREEFFLGILGKENTEMWNVRDRNYLRLCLAASKEKTLNNSSLHKIEDCSSITLKSPNVGSSSPSWKFKDLGSFSCAISLSALSHGLK